MSALLPSAIDDLASDRRVQHSYCVYAHKTADGDVVFYVGKAKINIRRNCFSRAYSSKNRNKFWHAVANKHGWRAEIVSYFYTVEEANTEERRLIASYGKRLNGGLLCNLADGGEGNAGCPRTDTWRDKISRAKLGKNLTAEHRLKLSMAHKGKTLSKAHREAIGRASSRLINFRLCDPQIQVKAQAFRKLVKTAARTAEHQAKINKANRGRKRSQESRIKMSIAAKLRRTTYVS